MKKTAALEKKITEVVLKLAATQDWEKLTLDQIARAAKLPAAEVKKHFASINDILPAIVHQTTSAVAASVGTSRGTQHDKLFEVMMARFDILQTRRKAILNIMDAVKRDPALARLILPAEAEAMASSLALAGLKQGEPQQTLAATGLLAIYGFTLYRWTQDETADMSKTMATLDRHLRRAGKLAEILFRAF